jgi:integrase
MSRTGYKRVYISNGAFFFVDRDRKWHRLCAVKDGEPAMLRALARHQNAPASRPGSIPSLVADWKAGPLLRYAECTQKDYGLMLANVEASMRDLDVAEITSHDVMDLRDQWRDKPRTANKYHALISVLMAYAIERRMRTDNPCRDVKKLREVHRKRLMTHDEQLKIAAAAVQGARGWKNANGAMYAALFDFAYLSALRARDARSLRWTEVDDSRGEILIEPTKTRDSSGAKIAIVITPDIRAVLETVRALGKVKSMFVFHTLKGKPLSASAIKSAWRRARERAGVADAWFRDLRPKALSDAKRQGLSLEKVRDAAGHTSVSTTEGYMRGFEVKEANLQLTLPKSKKTG